MWGTEVARGDGPVPFLVYQQRRRRVTELLDDAARWADRDHLVQGRRRVTFAAMAAAADRVAGHLAARGLGPGDRLLLLAANSPEWVISLWAGLRLGAVVAPGNRWWSAEEIAHAIELTAPAVIIADTEMARLLPAGTGAGTGPAVVPVADIRAAQSTPPLSIPEHPTGGEDDPALIIFTAGTTGLAKAAVLAHRSVIANLQNLLVVSKRLPHQLRGDRPPEVILQSGPLFHIGGVQSLLLAMLGGNTMVFLEGRFDSGQVLDLIERERVSIWGAVPTMAIRVLTDPTLPGRDLSAVRSISLGGSPVTPELSDRLRAAFPAVRRGVSTIYGMTEAGGTVAAVRRPDGRAPAHRRAAAAGRRDAHRQDRTKPAPARSSSARRPRCSGTGARTRRGSSTPTAGCTPATSAASTTACCTSPAGRRTSSSGAGRTSPRPTSRRCCTSTPRSRPSPSSRCPTPTWARSSAPSSSCAPRRPSPSSPSSPRPGSAASRCRGPGGGCRKSRCR